MSKTMILIKSKFIACVALISFLSISECDPLTEVITAGLTADLIHRDHSPESPSYDPTLSPSQRIVNALKRSFNRVQRFGAKRFKNTPESDIIYSGGDYLIKYSVGNPGVPSLGIADTGSDVIWTQCQPCIKCFKQSLPLFRPKSSHTYRKIHCNTTRCKSLQESYCSGTKKDCLYSEIYGDNSFTHGKFGTDTFTFVSNGRKRVSIPNVTFGCGYNNGGIFSGSESGIVGLGGGKASFVRQLGRFARGKFSYCLSSLSDHSNSSKLHFGSNGKVSGKQAVSTPLVKKIPETYYYLTLEGISVGNQTLEFFSDSGHDHGEGNIIIDSGTTLTFLPPGLYANLEKAIKSSIKLKQIKDPEGVLNLCYFTRKDILQIPEITVHFKGADVKLKHENVFARMNDVSVCLAAVQTEDLAIYGNIAQLNFLVGYDLKKRTVSFKPTDCGKS